MINDSPKAMRKWQAERIGADAVLDRQRTAQIKGVIGKRNATMRGKVTLPKVSIQEPVKGQSSNPS